jgi:hypothetical protein
MWPIYIISVWSTTSLPCDEPKAKLSQAETIRIFNRIFANIILKILSPNKFCLLSAASCDVMNESPTALSFICYYRARPLTTCQKRDVFATKVWYPLTNQNRVKLTETHGIAKTVALSRPIPLSRLISRRF